MRLYLLVYDMTGDDNNDDDNDDDGDDDIKRTNEEMLFGCIVRKEGTQEEVEGLRMSKRTRNAS